MELYRICYRARINWTRLAHDLPDEIDRTLGRIRRINRRAGVTGALLLADHHIIQLLEGQTGPVLDTLYCVMNDPRLGELEAIFHEPAGDRLFPNSLMFFRDLTDGVAAAAHPSLRPLIDETEHLSRDDGLAALACFAAEIQQGCLTNDLLLV